MNAFIGPGLLVEAVNGEQLDLPRLYKLGHGCHHSKIFKFVKPAALSWENQHRLAVVTVHLELHIVPQVRAPPTLVFYLQGTLLLMEF
jgi:hypothetical protein